LQGLPNTERLDFARFLSTQWLQVSLSQNRLSVDVSAHDHLTQADDWTKYTEELVEMIARMKWSLWTTEQDEPLEALS